MGKIDDRLTVLEAELRRVRELADQATERPAGHGPVRNPRLAKTFHADGVAYPTAPCTAYPIVFLDSTYTQTAGDQTPTDTARQAHAGALALYRGEDYLAEGTVVCVLWDHLRWWIIGLSGGGGNILWAVVQSGTNGTAQLHRHFQVKSCDYLGTNIIGGALDAVTPALGALARCNKDTALFAGYVVGYQIDTSIGSPVNVIVTDVYDDPLGSVRMVRTDGAIPDGWEECTEARGRFVLGHSAAGGVAPGGYEAGPGSGPTWGAEINEQLRHGGDPCGHGPHDTDTDALCGSGVQIYPFANVAAAKHVSCEHTPPFITYKLIKRTS